MKLVYYNFCPFSRASRIALLEKQISFSLDNINPWESFDDDVIVSSVSNIPMIVEELEANKKINIFSTPAIYEYLEDINAEAPLYDNSLFINAEIRRIISWMDVDFFNTVSSKLIEEKIIKRIKNREFPNSVEIKSAYDNLSYHMEYLDYLTSKRKWMAGNSFSMADICVASHVSILDYLGDIRWNEYPNAKDWYVKIKSRPSFRELLEDRIGNIIPSSNYKNLDF